LRYELLPTNFSKVDIQYGYQLKKNEIGRQNTYISPSLLTHKQGVISKLQMRDTSSRRNIGAPRDTLPESTKALSMTLKPSAAIKHKNGESGSP
jgi:hypothetical protein